MIRAAIPCLLFAISSLFALPVQAEEPQATRTEANEPKTSPQAYLRDVLRQLFKKDPKGRPTKEEEERKVSLFVAPIVASSPSMGTSFGAAFSAVGYRETDQEDVSSMLASTTYTSKGFLVVSARSSLSIKKRRRLMGDWRFYKYGERTYGLGSNTSDSFYQDYNYKWFRFKQAVLLPALENLHVGLGYDVDVRYDIQPTRTQGSLPAGPVSLPSKTVASGTGPVFIYDSTDNRVNASRGIYAEGAYRFFLKSLGSDENWQLLDVQARWYVRLPSKRRQVVAFWGLSQIV